MVRICCIGFDLCDFFGTRFVTVQHFFSFFRSEIFEFHYVGIFIKISSGNTGHFKVQTAGCIVLFDDKSIKTAQVAGNKFIERATDEILVGFIEYLCGKLA